MDGRKRLTRAIFIYLFAIAAPALSLLYLGLQSVQRQHKAIRTLAESNRVLANEKVAAELERRSMELAHQCLLEQQPSPPFRLRPPIVRHYFAIENGAVVFPRLLTPLPHEPDGAPQAFRDAERLEIREGKIREALTDYQAVYDASASKPVKALALSRVARCQERLQDRQAAAAAWRTLEDGYGDLYDPLHRPYALTARLELNQLDGLYEDLIQDRWDLSAEQFDYYLGRLNRESPPGNRFELARELGERFRPAAPLREGEIYSYTLPHDKLYYRGGRGGDLVFGFSVDDRWLQQSLLPAVRRELDLPQTDEPDSTRDLWVYGGATAAVLAVLLLGILMLVRDVARETQMNRLRAEFVGATSHELKTPITLIRLYAETLLDGKDFPEAERRGFYGIIARESERLGHLVQKVLSFSRIERGETEYSLQEGDLGAVIGQTVEVYRRYLERAGFAVETSIAESLPGVRFDPGAVSQAVVNLLDNAVKYSGESRFVAVRLRCDNDNAVLEVEDRGVGIPAGQQERIFERFYRAPNGGAKGGYGIGLFLVRHIMEAHSGRVEVESEPGRGSCFRLIFPVTA
jgi:signal transduction histidine kinase